MIVTFLQVNHLILLLLTIVTLSIGAQTFLPQVSYIKAIDIWMFSDLFNVRAILDVNAIGKVFFYTSRQKY